MTAKGHVATKRVVDRDARAIADQRRSRTHTRKLTPQQRQEAARRYWRGEGTLGELAAAYGISQTRMSQITRAGLPSKEG